MPFPALAERLADIRGRIESAVGRGGHAQQVRIIAVTKTFGPDAAIAVHDAGVADVGENKVQEALAKMDAVDRPLRWHLIGHLQRNKAKFAPRFALVHSMDSARLADALDEVGRRALVPLPVLLQVNVSGEGTKGGYEPSDMEREAERLRGLAGVRVQGVMTMAPLQASERVLRETFAGARAVRQVLADAGHPATELSMGMSQDYAIAVEEGATMVRLGTVLFGARVA